MIAKLTARRHLDARFQQLNLAALTRPPKGWVRAIRDALGMTTQQLANRLGISHARITAIEKDEVLGNLKLNTLARVAEAMDCQLVYALVPRQGLEAQAQAQATKKAKALLRGIEQSMALEAQPSTAQDDKAHLGMLIDQLLHGPNARLWDDP